MDRKRAKRAKPMDDGLWDCSVCTYKNSAEAFKCAMCDVRKGTSTRKPKPNPQLVAQQVAQQLPPPPPKREKHPHKKAERPDLSETDTSQDADARRPEQKDTTNCIKEPLSRHGKSKEFTTGMSMEVTVGDLTVVITDYEPKPKRKRSSTDSHDSSSFHSNTDSGSPSLSNGRVPD